eukprot:364080-Chlamydomonas_euryale.AAC.9
MAGLCVDLWCSYSTGRSWADVDFSATLMPSGPSRAACSLIIWSSDLLGSARQHLPGRAEMIPWQEI